VREVFKAEGFAPLFRGIQASQYIRLRKRSCLQDHRGPARKAAQKMRVGAERTNSTRAKQKRDSVHPASDLSNYEPGFATLVGLAACFRKGFFEVMPWS
jgi:hypothetical protein